MADALTLSRRALLALVPASALAFSLRPALAATAIGKAVSVDGLADLNRAGTITALTPDTEIELDDQVVTRNGSAQLLLTPDTLINLGAGAQLLIDAFIANQGGTLTLGSGALVFDRPDGVVPETTTIKTAFAMIGVRGTKFFAGPSKGAFGVFVERGEVRVLANGVARNLAAGDGVDIAAPGEAPSAVKKWGAPRIAEAYASVGL
jgi:ferric-dicitrate binding protein FerR (iron transport regulator)